MGASRKKGKKTKKSGSKLFEKAEKFLGGGRNKKTGTGGRRRKVSVTSLQNKILILKLKKKLNRLKYGGR